MMIVFNQNVTQLLHNGHMYFCFPGIDMTFLKLALDMSTNAVYSLHKSSTRQVSELILFDIINYKLEQKGMFVSVTNNLENSKFIYIC